MSCSLTPSKTFDDIGWYEDASELLSRRRGGGNRGAIAKTGSH